MICFFFASTAALFASCAGGVSTTAVPSVPQPNPSCELTRKLRRQAAEFYAQGKLDRTHRTVRKANQLCVQERASSFGLELQTLSDLGLEAEALILAREVSNSSEAKPEDKVQAALLLAKGTPDHPVRADAWLQEGLARKARGDLVAAQRLFDRALVALEQAASVRAILEPRGGLFDVSAMSWSPDGTKLAVAAGSKIHILQTEDYHESLRIHPNAAPVLSVAFSPDAQTLVLGTADNHIEWWDLPSAARVGTVEFEPDVMQTLVFSPDGTLLAGLGWQRPSIPLWSVPSRTHLRTLDMTFRDQVLVGGRGSSIGTDFRPAMLAFSPDGSMLVANAADNAVLRWDANTYARLPEVKRAYYCSGELRPWANTLGFTMDGKLIASAPSGQEVELWNAETGQLKGSLTVSGQTLHVRSVAVSPHDPIVVAAGGNGIRVWQLPSAAELPMLTAPNGVDSVVFSADGRWLFGASRRGAVSVWAMPSGALQLTLQLVDDATAFARSASGLVEWLGSQKPEANCKLGERFYPAELCEERYATTGLITRVLSGRDVMPDPYD